MSDIVDVEFEEETEFAIELDEGGSGTSDHRDLSNRDAANQHPISAITGLRTELDGKVTAQGVDTILAMDREDYEALTDRPSTTVYLIRG